MALSETGSRTPDTLVISNSSAEIALRTLVTFPLSPMYWDAMFRFDDPQIPRKPAELYIRSLEAIGIAPFTILTLKFNRDIGIFEEVPSYADYGGLRELTLEEVAEDKKPHQYRFINEREDGFKSLKGEFLADLIKNQYVLDSARIFPGTYEFNGHVAVNLYRVALHGNLGIPLREGSPITGPKEKEVRDWFKELKASAMPDPVPTVSTNP